MKNICSRLTITALTLAFALPAAQRQPSIDDFFRDFTADWVRHDSNLATRTRYFSGDEQRDFERELTPQTKAYMIERIDDAKRGLAQLRGFDRVRMSDSQRVSADVMQWQLDAIVSQQPYLDYVYPFEQFSGTNVNLVNFLTVVHPLSVASDAENYVAALGQVATRVREAIAESRHQAAEGIVPPRFILQATIKQMQDFVSTPPAQNPFVSIFAQKMAAMKDISGEQRETLRGQSETIVSTQIYPAWKEATALLESQLPNATDEAGLDRFKNGSAVYAYYLQRFTTTDMTADQIHELGLKQVAQIESQMNALLDGLGYTQGSVDDRVAKLKQDMGYPDATSDGSRAQIMTDIRGILTDAQQRSTLLFDKQPKAAVIAQPYPSFREANAAASYSPPTPDGSRPGVFQFPLRLDQMTKFGLRSVIYHETVPGHHFQLALELEDTSLPRFRRLNVFGNIPALTEGWGLYAERLAAELGWYQDDPKGLLGQLNYELFRARRLVVDTGIHSDHWTRQQAIDYGIEPSEVERYVVYPGQACSYMIGEMKILQLRDKAQRALGEHFSLKQFHDVILDTGTVPLSVLEQQVDAYVKANSHPN